MEGLAGRFTTFLCGGYDKRALLWTAGANVGADVHGTHLPAELISP